MSSMNDPCTVEYWVDESVYNVSDEVRERIVEKIDEWGLRESIEEALVVFDQGSQSWRTYRDLLWCYLSDRQDEEIARIIKG